MPTMKGKRVLMSLYIDTDIYAAVKQFSKDTRVPAAVYLREAVDDLLEKYEIEVPTTGVSE